MKISRMKPASRAEALSLRAVARSAARDEANRADTNRPRIEVPNVDDKISPGEIERAIRRVRNAYEEDIAFRHHLFERS